jgi:16S rRNA (uracil1498-N3)-methyltransferase
LINTGSSELMTRRSFTLSADEIQGDTILLRGRRAAHFRKAFGKRLAGAADSSAVELLVEDGSVIEAVLEELSSASISLRCLSRKMAAGPDRQLILAAAIIKPRKMDFLVEQAAELGVTRLIPLRTARTITAPGAAVSPNRLERWRGKALSARAMNDRPYPTTVEAPQDICSLTAGDGLKMLVLHASGSNPLSLILKRTSPGDLILVVGPEGDLTAEELSVLDAKGAERACLGKDILRAETAALAAV